MTVEQLKRFINSQITNKSSASKIESWLVNSQVQEDIKNSRNSVDSQIQKSQTESQKTQQEIALPSFDPTSFLTQQKFQIPISGAQLPPHPWKITTRPTNNNEYEYAVEKESMLFDGFGGNKITVVGADGDFRSVKAGYYYIEVEFNSDGTIQKAEIKINENIGPLVVFSGSPKKQTKLKQQIGYIDFENNIPVVIQSAWHNYTLFNSSYNGAVAKLSIAT